MAPVLGYAPSKRTYHVVSELAQNSVGALSDVLARLAKANLNLLSVSSASQPTSAVAVASLFAEPVGEELTDEDAKALVEKSPRVLSALVESSDGGVLLEKQLFPAVLLTGQRVMMIRVDAIASMLKSTREKFGSGGEVVVYQEGYEAGLSEASGLVKMMGRDEIVRHAEQIATFRTALGWGEASLTKVRTNPWKAILGVEDSFECRGQSSKKPCSQFMRGHSAGLKEGIPGVKVTCTETECVAPGDPHREFETVQTGS